MRNRFPQRMSFYEADLGKPLTKLRATVTSGYPPAQADSS
jgi:hypothetical protein